MYMFSAIKPPIRVITAPPQLPSLPLLSSLPPLVLSLPLETKKSPIS